MQTKKLFAGLLSAAMALTSMQGMPLTRAAQNETEFYVSPDGSDTGDGSLTSPFQTLEAAKAAVRSVKGDVTVYLRGGEYALTQPLVFTPEDSAAEGCRITYKAYADETPVLSGAVSVTGWTKKDDKLWTAPLDRDTKLRNLYVNDRRAHMGSISVQAKGGWGDYSVNAGQADWAWDSGKRATAFPMR